jgi:glucose/arabinose dehydrogenase
MFHRRLLATSALIGAALLLPVSSGAQIQSQIVVTGVSEPVAFVQDPSAPDVFYIVEKTGRVRTLRNGVLLATDFADLRGLVSAVFEQGLLGMAFAPDAAETGRVFFSYTDLSGRTVISRYNRVTSPTPRIDTTSRLDLRWSTGERFITPAAQGHIGGNLAFGADGYLYIAKGDAGNANSPQDPNTLVGKMLRIDVNVPSSDTNGMRVPPDNPFLDGSPVAARPEIWAFGLRNPWRYSSDNVGDGATGAFFIGDVGALTREEISFEPRNGGGRNYGWPIREGSMAGFAGAAAFFPLTDPLLDYGRSEGASVTGGFVYRGRVLGSSYVGRYFYADYVAGRVWSVGLTIDPTGNATVSGCGTASGCDIREHTTELAPLGNISSFGRDAAGELYLVIFDGHIRKIVGLDTTAAGTISNIPDQQINEDTSTATLNFTVNDGDDPPAQWSVTAISSDTTLIPNGNLLLSGSGSSRSIRVTPAPNRFGTAFVTVTFSSDSSRPGAAVSDTFVVTVNSIDDGPPTIGDVPNVTGSEDVRVGPLAVSVNDADGPNALNLSATSSNQTLVPDASFVLGGIGSARTVTFTPAPNQSGTATITLTVSDGFATATDTFVVTVAEVNDPPTISGPPSQTVSLGTAAVGPLPVTIGDVETPGSLTLAATSSNQALVANSGISLGGTGSARTISINITPGVTGTATITLTVSDASAQSVAVFSVIVSDPSAPPPPPPVPVAPTPPRNVIAEVLTGRTIALRWDAPAAAVTGYQIEVGRSSGGTDAGIFTTGATTTFTIGNLSAGQYFIRVRATSDAGLSDPSNEVIATLDGSSLSPRAPRNLRATVIGLTLQLNWDAPTDAQGLAGYVVEAGSGPGLANYARAIVPALAITVQNVPRATYHLRVRAVTSSGDGPPSNELIVVVGETTTLCVSPSAPFGLVGHALGTTVNLAWRAPASGTAPTRYVIHAGSASGSTDIAAIPIDGAFTSVAGSAPNGTLFVRVIAINACGISEPSNEISVTVGGPPPSPPGAPTNVTSEVAGSRVTIRWSPPVSGGAVVSYVVHARDQAGNLLAALGTGDATSFLSQDNVPPGVYLLTVQGVNAGGAGPPSEPLTVRVP